VLDGLGGIQGTRGTGSKPTYVTAEAATSELPQVFGEDPPKSPVKRSRIGDLPMRVIYRILAAVIVVVLAAVAAVVGFVMSGSSGQPDEGPPGPIAAPSAATPSSGVSSPPPSASASPAVPSSSPSTFSSASPSQTAALATPAPDRSAVVAALADPRVPDLPRDKRLALLPGKPYKGKTRLRDNKAGVSLARFAKPWKLYGASPFSTKQVLPAAKGAAHRAMIVSCPVPIQVQKDPKDTALLAARWTLNHHPKGSKIAWTASQPIKGGWLLAYRVKYEVKGKPHFSQAAVTVTEVPDAKPAMLFVTIPDVQRSHWRDINTAVSSLRLK
jgi:hypothetical protein